jgi:hypothetical protein
MLVHIEACRMQAEKINHNHEVAVAGWTAVQDIIMPTRMGTDN